MLEEIIQWDKTLFVFLNGLGNTTWDGFWLFITHKWSAIPLYLALLGLSFKYLGWKKTAILLLFVALLITTTDQLANFFKYGIKRFRPCHDENIMGAMRMVKSYCGGKYGYFSAHAASSMALATFFTFLFKQYLRWLPFILVFWALLVGYSRIYIGVHFPGDVFSGVLIGVFFGWVYAKLYIFTLQKYRV